MLLFFAVALFAVIHLVPAFPSIKARLKDRLGKKYGMLFAVGSIVSLVLIVVGWQMADRAAIYDPPVWGFRANLGLSFLAFLLLGVFLFRGKATSCCVCRWPWAWCCGQRATCWPMAIRQVSSCLADC